MAAALLTGCSSPWTTEPAPNHTIEHSVIPSDTDKGASKQAAQDFVRASSETGDIYELQDSVERVFGGWEKGSDRAFIATSLHGSRATPDNGRIIANAFSYWQNSETGDGRVSVYDSTGELLYRGQF